MKITITTDDATMTTVADTLADALALFGAPKHVTDEETFETWLEEIDGRGQITVDDEVVARVK